MGGLLGSVVSRQVLFLEGVFQVLLDFLDVNLLWLDHTDDELRRYAESQHSLNESTHDFQVHQGRKQLLEVVETPLQKSLIARSHFLSQLGFQVFVGNVGFSVVVEFLAGESVLLQYPAEILSLLLESGDSPKLVSIGILVTKVLVGKWHNSWQLH